MLDPDKQRALARATALLSQGDDAALPYAALELRFVLECITYSKLRLYAKRIPDEVLAAWQPPQAMRALKEFEPHADENFTLRIAREGPDGRPVGRWQPLGEHKTIELAQLRKWYNKLGSYLHLPTPKRGDRIGKGRQAEADQIRKDLGAIATGLGPAVAGDFDSSLAAVFYFTCTQCGKEVIRNVRSARATRRAVCLGPSCSAEYHLVFSDTGDVGATLIATVFVCGACDGPIPIENRSLKIGLVFPCPGCAAEHQIVSREWCYGPVDPASPAAADDA